MNILVINCGSSSLKFQLIDAQTEKLIAKGIEATTEIVGLVRPVQMIEDGEDTDTETGQVQ